MMENQRNSITVPADPGYMVIHVDGDTSPYLLCRPILAWEIESGGRAYPITAGCRLHFDEVRSYGLKYPDGHVAWHSPGDDDYEEFRSIEAFEEDIRREWAESKEGGSVIDIPIVCKDADDAEVEVRDMEGTDTECSWPFVFAGGSLYASESIRQDEAGRKFLPVLTKETQAAIEAAVRAHPIRGVDLRDCFDGKYFHRPADKGGCYIELWSAK
jgi:hypothetical protein